MWSLSWRKYLFIVYPCDGLSFVSFMKRYFNQNYKVFVLIDTALSKYYEVYFVMDHLKYKHKDGCVMRTRVIMNMQ